METKRRKEKAMMEAQTLLATYDVDVVSVDTRQNCSRRADV